MGRSSIRCITEICAGGLIEDIRMECLVSNPLSVETKRYWALWDTGASRCAISKKAAQELNLISLGNFGIKHIGSTQSVAKYKVNLFLSEGIEFRDVEMYGTPHDDFNHDIIIGMNIITQGDFAISHSDDKTMFSFRYPSNGMVDLKQYNNLQL